MTEDASVADAMLDVLGCAVPPKSAVYLSTPLTSGPRSAVRRQAAELRQRLGLVMTPMDLNVDGWTPGHYRAFWSEVMDRYVRLVVLADGWSLSTGCVTEFIMARSAAVPVVDYQEREIDDVAATRLLGQAVATLQAAGQPTHAQIAALATLDDNPISTRLIR